MRFRPLLNIILIASFPALTSFQLYMMYWKEARVETCIIETYSSLKIQSVLVLDPLQGSAVGLILPASADKGKNVNLNYINNFHCH